MPAGSKEVIILVSGGINEDVLLKMMAAKAPIDGFGIGVNLDASIDAPSLDCAYKLQEYAGRPRRKLSEGKQSPGPAASRCGAAYDAHERHARRRALARERQARWRSACRAGDAWRQARCAGADARANPRTR